MKKVRAEAETALAYLRSGASWRRFGCITPGEFKHCLYLTKEVLVDGNESTSLEHLQTACDYLAIEFSFEELFLAWQGVAPGLPHESRPLRIADLMEQHSDANPEAALGNRRRYPSPEESPDLLMGSPPRECPPDQTGR